jgi:hypothetical protein
MASALKLNLIVFVHYLGTSVSDIREEHRLRVFENRVLMRIHVFGPNRGEVTGGLRKLHNEELHNL